MVIHESILVGLGVKKRSLIDKMAIPGVVSIEPRVSGKVEVTALKNMKGVKPEPEAKTTDKPVSLLKKVNTNFTRLK